MFTILRIVIHVHSLNYTNPLTNSEVEIDECLMRISITLYYIYNFFDNYIENNGNFLTCFLIKFVSFIQGKVSY